LLKWKQSAGFFGLIDEAAYVACVAAYTVQKKKTGRKPKVQKQELETVLEVPLDSDYDTLI